MCSDNVDAFERYDNDEIAGEYMPAAGGGFGFG